MATKCMILAHKRGGYMYLPHEVKKPFEIIEYFSAFEHDCDSSYSFEGEFHNFWEILILTEGELCTCEDDNVYTLKKNHIIFHKPNAFHNLQAASENVKYVVISFNVFGNYMDRFANKVLTLSNEQMDYVNKISQMFEEEGMDSRAMKITKFLKIMKEKPVLYHRFTNYVELLLISLSENDVSTPKLVDNEETRLYKKAINTLEEKIFSNISVEELARECNISTAQLKRVFSKYAGIGIHEYFLQIKILYAKKLLSGGMGVTEVAEKMSFSSQNYFSIVFKREEGISPSQFKRQITK